MCFPPDSDQQYDSTRTSETVGSTHKELNFRTAKQRTCCINKRQTSNISEADKSHEVMNVFLSSQVDNQVSELDTSGKISDPYFLCACIILKWNCNIDVSAKD
jgi:hypothetical protein